MSTSVTNVVSHFPSAENGFTTTLASTISSGATTVPLNSVAGYTNGEVIVFVIDPSDATKKQTFTGIVDTAGVQITSVVWTAGTNQAHAGGATVVDYATATHISMVTKGLLVEHNQDGTHGDVNADSLDVSGAANLTDLSVSGTLSLPAGSLETADYGNASVTGEKIANYKIVRQNNTSNSTENTARILTGWGVIAVGGVATGTEVVTFDSAFTSIPIVTLTYGGDNASSTTYGSGSINLKQAYGGAISLTTTTFTAYIRSADGTNWPGGAQAFYQWTAIGV